VLHAEPSCSTSLVETGSHQLAVAALYVYSLLQATRPHPALAARSQVLPRWPHCNPRSPPACMSPSGRPSRGSLRMLSSRAAQAPHLTCHQAAKCAAAAACSVLRGCSAPAGRATVPARRCRAGRCWPAQPLTGWSSRQRRRALQGLKQVGPKDALLHILLSVVHS
jgi:hypothetical protein